MGLANSSAPPGQSKMAGYQRPDPYPDNIYLWYVSGTFSQSVIDAMEAKPQGTFTRTADGIGCEKVTNSTSGFDNSYCAVDVTVGTSYLVTDMKILKMNSEDADQAEVVAFLGVLRRVILAGSNAG